MNEDFYSSEAISESLDDDGMSAAEAAFMEGYVEEL